MIQCHWCGFEMDDEEVMTLDLDLPNCKEAHMHITNNLCPPCQTKVLEALGTLELKIKAWVGSQ
jgi:hypothetical protein